MFNSLFSANGADRRSDPGGPPSPSGNERRGEPVREGRYARRELIAEGGMGLVYLGFDKHLERNTALKYLRREFTHQEAGVRDFVREARITAQLEHPNIMPVHDLVQDPDGTLFFTMKCVEGEPLSVVLHELAKGEPRYHEAFTRFRLLTIFRSMCNATAYAHSRNIIHQDIKPGNVMVAPHGEVVLMDWGIAQTVEGNVDDSTCPQVPTLGSPRYMAPEQAMRHPGDRRTDVFLLGATLYHMITLYPPYLGSSNEELIRLARICRPIAPAHRAPNLQIPVSLCQIIEKAMARERDDRFQTVEELVQEVDEFLSGRTDSTTRVYRAGEHLIRAGERAEEGYVIHRGQVAVLRECANGETTLLDTLGPGDVVGEMAVLTGETRATTVIALDETQVEVLTADQIRTQLGRLAPWMTTLVEGLARRLRQTCSLVQH